jgi:NAD(P)-dependent dehydrogenase (short-subunit alcohol dehydrogenase family)
VARFTDKIAIVTGASTGVGPVMAAKLVAEGAKVVIAARRLELLEEVAAGLGDAAVAVRADVTQEDDVAAMVETAMGRWGRVDVMINNAAVPGTDLYVWENTLENWNATFAVDVTAAFLCSREVLRRSMLERRSGVIVNFSTGAAWTGMVRKSHYASAKVAVHALTKTIALEGGPYGIRCNCVVPGLIETDLLRNYLERTAGEEGITVDEKRAALMATAALPFPSQPDDVANLALFLASDDARTITGQSIAVDAGHFMMG